jgi:SAM-dependent methyltransferase
MQKKQDAGPAYSATDGAAYERFMGRWSRLLSDAVVALADPLPEGPLLDVGTGTGSMALALAGRYPGRAVTGADVSKPYLAFAAERPGASGISFACEDACEMSFADDSFAAAFAVLLLNFVGQPLQAVREMRRIVRTGGLLVAAGWDFRGGLVYQRLLWDSAASIDPGAAAVRDRLFAAPLALPTGMTDLFQAAGLAGIRRDSVTIRMAFADFADYWEPLLGRQGPVGGYVAGLPADTQQAVREAVRAAYLAGALDGERSLTATAWVVRGTVPAGAGQG